MEKRLEDELEGKLNKHNAMKDECEDKVARADFAEDELENAFRKNPNFNLASRHRIIRRVQRIMMLSSKNNIFAI